MEVQTVGMIAHLPPQPDEAKQGRLAAAIKMVFRPRERAKPTVYGATIAYQNFTRAILAELASVHFCLCCSPSSLFATQQFRDSLEADVKERIQVISYNDISRTVAQKSWLGWMDDTGQIATPFDLRSNYAKTVYPIAFSHHSLSYPKQLHGEYLSLILSDTFECDTFVCTSKAAKRMVDINLDRIADLLAPGGAKRQFNGRIEVIPLGVDCRRFYPRPKQKCRDRFGILEKDIVVLYLGRLSAIDKGDLFPFILAFQQVIQKHPNLRVKLIVAGQSYNGYGQLLFKSLRKAGIARNVVFMPRVQEEDKPYLYGSADIFVSPADNLQECFGQTVIEAMACGVPQLVSDWDGYRDLVVHGETGFLVPTLWGDCDSDLHATSQVFSDHWQLSHYLMAQAVSVDTSAMVRYLEKLVLNNELRMKMAHASRERAESIFDWKIVARQYQSLLVEMKDVALRQVLSQSNSYRKPQFFDSACHFATKLISEDMILVRKGYGITMDGRPFMPYGGMMTDGGEQSRWNLRGILDQTSIPISLRELRRKCSGNVTCERAVFTRQVLWLLKYSFLAIFEE